MTGEGWIRVGSKYPTPHTVYWWKRLADGGRLTVSRVYNEDGSFTPGGLWSWRIYAKPTPKRFPNGRVLAGGRQKTVQQAKRAVEKRYELLRMMEANAR